MDLLERGPSLTHTKMAGNERKIWREIKKKREFCSHFLEIEFFLVEI